MYCLVPIDVKTCIVYGVWNTFFFIRQRVVPAVVTNYIDAVLVREIKKRFHSYICKILRDFVDDVPDVLTCEMTICHDNASVQIYTKNFACVYSVHTGTSMSFLVALDAPTAVAFGWYVWRTVVLHESAFSFHAPVFPKALTSILFVCLFLKPLLKCLLWYGLCTWMEINLHENPIVFIFWIYGMTVSSSKSIFYTITNIQ